MRPAKTSARKRILEVLTAEYGEDYMTAAEIKKRIKEYSLRTISSTLTKMTKKGTIARRKGVGPRGGYGYSKALSLTDIIERNSVKQMQEAIDNEFLQFLQYSYVSKKV